jgi:DnaD/phage-associated family protein
LDPIFQLYQQNIEREIGPILRANIEAAVDPYSAAWVAEAIEIAVNKGPSGRNWGYVQGVLRKWASEGKEQPQRTTGNKYEDDYASRFGGQEQADPGPDPAEADPAVQQLWGQVLADLQERLPRPAYDTYIKGVRALRTDQRSMTLEVPNRVIFAHLERSYYGTIQQSIKRVSGDDLDICFRLGSPGQVT